ncbi:tRNA (N6-threonylcarbamoyladenosine(37)-N6)-methyltransferase TrmO [[Haemophilus] ducreyi]|uniref:tRNA (N6-threonylcarbamoyladenosine(37)-N6)-methyltransferase TrmO n=1 Tax=Haemophilus ducreyi TaxID=730 RepID=UPI0007CDF366|nr:tRNA (N6-threonylcarbamoyladenosine(37)-N6)-methyltransferase TrmO [[Haemophilus] ducreyi]ANF71161.1 tRNA (N6-threonylcarbamoyladenosine(37)-N6)-methyltransferase TrmO [[Haemophilus] ducreyi]ANF71657.1 tRNA (N6-threonylcarbamoyladenosine(37)-N6)-methyltransferase TrmO [[Haemophilus] ducreyi]
MANPQPLVLNPIGVIESPYDEKFSVPRQPNLVAQGKGNLTLFPPYNCAEAVRGLAQFSHLWLIFQFHQLPAREWHSTVRPPRLGGNQRIGVFASRATHRPNPIGLSKVALEAIEIHHGKAQLKLGSVDLVNGTPILDIKPYIAYADSEPEAISGFAQHKPPAMLSVEFTQQALQAINFCKNFAKFGITQPLVFIQQLIEQDPRPAYQQGKITSRIYGMRLAGYNIRWQICESDPNKAMVIAINH